MGCYDTGNIDMSIKHELEQKPDQLSWRIKAVIFSVVIGILLYVGASVYAGRAAVWTVMQKIGWTGLIISLLLSLLNYLLRFFRWQLYLRHLNYAVSSMPYWRIYLAGFASSKSAYFNNNNTYSAVSVGFVLPSYCQSDT